MELGEDMLVHRKLDVRRVLEAIAREMREKGLDLERVEKEVEEEADRVAAEKIEKILGGY